MEREGISEVGHTEIEHGADQLEWMITHTHLKDGKND